MSGHFDFGPFLALDEAARARLAAGSHRVSFARRAYIVREGDPPEDAYVIEIGRLRVLQGGAVVATAAAPALVGEMSVLSGEPRSATVAAATRAIGYRVPADTLRRLADEQPEFGASGRARARVAGR